MTDTIIHFGSPSCKEEFTKQSTDKMIQDVIELLKLPQKRIIFASSVGATFREPGIQGLYNDAKLQCENLIKNSNKDYTILRIPRVYGKDRKKGLMNYIKNETIQDWNEIIEYIDIDDFVSETFQKLKTTPKYIFYESLQQNTIREIKEKYKL